MEVPILLVLLAVYLPSMDPIPAPYARRERMLLVPPLRPVIPAGHLVTPAMAPLSAQLVKQESIRELGHLLACLHQALNHLNNQVKPPSLFQPLSPVVSRHPSPVDNLLLVRAASRRDSRLRNRQECHPCNLAPGLLVSRHPSPVDNLLLVPVASR